MVDEAELDGAVSDLPEAFVVLDQGDGLAGERLVDVDEPARLRIPVYLTAGSDFI